MHKIFGIVIILVLVLGVMCFFSYVFKTVTAEDARSVNYKDYGDFENEAKQATNHNEFHLEKFLKACGCTDVVFQNDEDTISANCRSWSIQIQNYVVESGSTDPCWRTEIRLSKKSLARSYAFGYIKGSMPQVMSQPEQVLVCDENGDSQRMEKTALMDLIELMTSGELLEDIYNPLWDRSFSYVKDNAKVNDQKEGGTK